MTSESDYREALRRLPKDTRIAVLCLEQKISAIGDVNIAFSEREKKDVLDQVSHLNEEIADLKKELNSRIDQIKESRAAWERSAQENREEFRAKLEELFELLKQFRIDGRLVVEARS